LASVKVVELAGMGPSPHTTMLLADLGADVIRIQAALSSAGDASLPPTSRAPRIWIGCVA
jgi:alpha-methylacyl-CoA racemase